ncbi:hypothetical protein P3T27_002263 [Kitasatospora sp. MAA19]|uniref:hypothetical protein n=1 Tax=Kitasatospora sp. MAA19 TaxID=3035090 RepID=UPI002473ECE3|nr:hypothetical protein [Kitasatospora sp. MAA19]MDH6705553.1 hypothetical protein [Kitasatospora sp. MAA19]
MRSYTTKLTVAALAAATALSLAACGPDSTDTPAGAGGATGAAPAPTTAASGAATGGSATGGAATGGSPAAPTSAAPGAGTAGATGGGAGGAVPAAATAVKVGRPATVDFADKTSKVATKLEITVTGVEAGSLQELTAAKVPTTGLEGRTPMYVSYTIKNLGDASLSFTAPDSKFVVFDNTGQKGLNVMNAANPLPKCTGAKFQGVTKGVEAKGCIIIATTGTAPVAVGYTDLTDLLKLQASWTK